jgi:glutamyl-Q tRNA(Asp) synthetase
VPRENTAYRGRFAPSPTGPLHLGSLIAALASYLDARCHDCTWLVRIDDLDPPREEPGAADGILSSLQHHGMHWDSDVLYQGTRSAVYDEALAALGSAGLLFACDCTRAMLGDAGNCLGNCRARQEDIGEARSIRINVPAACDIRFTDLLQGPQQVALGTGLPDFILRRKDGLYAYQLAVVVDDAAQGITHVVRGSDLLDSTPRQVYLQQCLGLPTPRYAHLPVITNREGQKFSKQTLAPTLENAAATPNLRLALRFLNQPEPPLAITHVAELLAWATSRWDLQRVPAEMAINAQRLGLER